MQYFEQQYDQIKRQFLFQVIKHKTTKAEIRFTSCRPFLFVFVFLLLFRERGNGKRTISQQTIEMCVCVCVCTSLCLNYIPYNL